MDDGRTVLVTGASSGIGLATAIEAARHDLHVVGTVRSEAKAAHVVAAARDADVTVHTELLDVTDDEGCRRVVERTRPWAVVNNAGFGAVGAVEDVGDDEARLALETMVLAPMRLARLSLPHMRRAGSGRIVNVSSVYGFTTTALSGWYQGAKHALEALSDALRMEVARDDIAVVLVEPGGFDTGIWDENDEELERHGLDSRYAEGYRRTRQLTGWYRPLMGKPDEVARAVVGALVDRHPRARYLVGRDAWAIAAADRLALRPVRDRLNRLVLGL